MVHVPTAVAGEEGPACAVGLIGVFRERRLGEVLGAGTSREAGVEARGPMGTPQGGLTRGFALARAMAVAEAVALARGRVGAEAVALRGRPRMAIEGARRMAIARLLAIARIAFAMFLRAGTLSLSRGYSFRMSEALGVV